ncbi:metal-sulfur cluster assembly factor [Brevibacillus sp. SYSU BS000544]|uniref:metal-sulfur cluster assembly factor n=1 Tax=Brevibacillus sp. SYSU BS000544 TaxID=3416443 RepID=UPI003CE4FBA3
MHTNDQLKELLKSVIDPELGVNIVDLGLVYNIEQSENGEEVIVTMTLTTPGCPLHDSIVGGVKSVLKSAGINLVTVDLVWAPAWSPDKMTDAARKQLGRL